MNLRLAACLVLAVAVPRFCHAQPPASPPSAVRTLAVRTTGDAAVEAAIRAGNAFRWLPRRPDLAIVLGREAQGEVEIVAEVLPASAATAARLHGLPVGTGPELTLAGQPYGEAADALAVRLPGEPKPVWVVVGRRPAAVAGMVDELLLRLTSRRRGRSGTPDFDYSLRETRWLSRTGKWRPAAGAGVAAWEVDPAADHDEIGARDRAVAALRPVASGAGAGGIGAHGTRVILRAPAAEASRPEIVRLAADLERAAAEMAPRVSPTTLAALATPVTVGLEADFVAQARNAGEIGAAVLTLGRSDISIVYHADDLFAYRYALAQVLLVRSGLPGLQAAPWIAKGAALWLAGDWYGRPYRDWLPALAAAGALPTAAQLLAAAPQDDGSEPLWTPAAAAVIDGLPGLTLAEKLAVAPAGPRVEKLLAGIDRLPRLPRPPAPPSSRPAVRPAAVPFAKGVSLAMLNSLEDGYHAPGLDARLASLAQLGVNAVSLMPFAYQEAPDRPHLSYLNRGPESESDAGLIHAVRRARARGFAVLYKPHIWVGGDHWPGDIAMASEADWAAWFAGYRRYLLHHALLAGWAGADTLSVGCELAKTTARTEDWRRLIAAVRELYPGRLTYSANWGGDFEQVAFWDRLDVAGVDAYYPLAATAQASPAQLAAGARQVVDRLAAGARRAGKPLLLTEVGFAAHAAAWTAPHEEGGVYSAADQAAAYHALFAALGEHREHPWLAGTYVWKVFSGGEDRWRRDEPDFRFLGRPAEAVVREYYSKK